MTYEHVSFPLFGIIYNISLKYIVLNILEKLTVLELKVCTVKSSQKYFVLFY